MDNIISVGQELLTTQQTKQVLGCGDTTLWRYAKLGYIKKIKLGKKTNLYHRDSIENFLLNSERIIAQMA